LSNFRDSSEKDICDYLNNKNFTILEHNKVIQVEHYKIEIDIIAFDEKNQILHFIEVKNWKANPYIHPVIKEIYKRKNKLLLSSKIYLSNIINNIDEYHQKCEYKNFLCLLKTTSPWDLNISFDLVWKKGEKIYHFKNILRST
jgi:Holliday junction resolvase-like predicted endonuclease